MARSRRIGDAQTWIMDLDTSHLDASSTELDTVLETTTFVVATNEDPATTMAEDRYHKVTDLDMCRHPTLKHKYNIMTGSDAGPEDRSPYSRRIQGHLDMLAFAQVTHLPDGDRPRMYECVLPESYVPTTEEDPTFFANLPGWKLHDDEVLKQLLQRF
ncbi:hypothetical protein E8E11_004250 [Didymella keratinophila]|nr:hypothetical protein E8E11_004250 [Didymella keratinophila]